MKYLPVLALLFFVCGAACVCAEETTKVTITTPAVVVTQPEVVTLEVLKAHKATLVESLKTATKEEAVKINAKIVELDAQIKAMEVK